MFVLLCRILQVVCFALAIGFLAVPIDFALLVQGPATLVRYLVELSATLVMLGVSCLLFLAGNWAGDKASFRRRSRRT